ncbi:MAG: protein translocase subunit SecD [Anaerolineales bacterium]|nr:protein translocase subunit SecD [Anaerolineales bacterium]
MEQTRLQTRDIFWFIAIVGIVIFAIWLIQSPNYPIQPGLDIQGGLQVLLEADVPPDEPVTAEQMETAQSIISQRVNGLGVSEPLVQVNGDRRIVIELPGLENSEDAISLVQETALLEFVDSGFNPLPEGLCIRTTENEGLPSPCEQQQPDTAGEVPVLETVMTGAMLQEANIQTDQFMQNFVAFTLTEEGGQIFQEYTSTHVGQFLTIVLDKRVVSSPQINAVIERQGTITGNFTVEEAERLALQLRFGSLPIPLRVEGTRQVGATLGEQSIDASIRAGIIGLAVVLLFMLIYYRLPGGLADVALVIYALLNIAAYQFLGVTITLPALAGFLLSTGMAVDANILVFERMKEELRAGATLTDAIGQGFDRAWSSIRDSNIATLVVCFILLLFGRSFGASMVQGFAWTLMIGVLISMFTAVIVTRTFIQLVMTPLAKRLAGRDWLLGL